MASASDSRCRSLLYSSRNAFVTRVGIKVDRIYIGYAFDYSLNDIQRRNRIVQLLSDWGLITVSKPESIADVAPLNQIKVLAFKEKDEWTLESKYNIGRKKVEATE